MKALSLSAALVLVAAPIAAETALPESVVTEAQGNVMYCLLVMGEETTWPQCAGLLFSPCAEFEVGAADHAACLTGERRA